MVRIYAYHTCNEQIKEIRSMIRKDSDITTKWNSIALPFLNYLYYMACLSLILMSVTCRNENEQVFCSIFYYPYSSSLEISNIYIFEYKKNIIFLALVIKTTDIWNIWNTQNI